MNVRLAGRKLVIATFFAAGLGWLGPAVATDAVNTTPEGVALDGYDPVAYFTLGRPLKGEPGHSLEWNGATWHFASAEHRELFGASPERYAPQYNGWCSVAVSTGYAAEVDVLEGWMIHRGKLYLNWDEDVLVEWSDEIDERLPAAEANWPAVRAGLADGSTELFRHADHPQHNPHRIAHPQ